MPIDATNGLSGVVPSKVAPGGHALTDLREPLACRLLLERDDLALAIEPEDAHG